MVSRQEETTPASFQVASACEDDASSDGDESSLRRVVLPQRAVSALPSMSMVEQQQIPERLRDSLQTASCLNQSWTIEQLRVSHHRHQDTPTFEDVIVEAVERGLLVKLHEIDQYEFATPELRCQVYDSIAPDNGERAKRHFHIARQLWRSSEQANVNMDQVMIVQQFLRGESQLPLSSSSSLPIQTDERYPLAALCLSAGKRLVRRSKFDPAAAILNFGVRLLTTTTGAAKGRDPTDSQYDRCWHDEYDLSLAVYQAAAEVNYCAAQFDAAEQCIDAVRKNARSFADTHGVYTTHVSILGARRRRQEAISMGLEVLEKMGMSFPNHPNKAQILWNFVKTRRLLAHKSNEMLLRMPLLEDDTAMAALRMLNLIFSHAFSARPSLVPVLVFRMTQLTAKQGLSVMSSVAFANYGMILSGMRLYEDATRYALLALALLERFPVQEWLPRVYTGVYGGVFSSVKPLESTLEPLRRAYRVGLSTGDMEFALIAAHIYAYNLFSLCRPLPFLEDEMLQFYQAAQSRKQDWVGMRHALFLQLLQNLRGKARDNPTRLTGDIYDEERADPRLFESDVMSGYFFHFYKLMLCYLFHDLEEAVQHADASRELSRAPSGHVGFSFLPLFDGLSALAYARQAPQKEQQVRKRQAIGLAHDKIRVLKQRALQNPVICSGKLFLLEAEVAWTLQQPHVASQKFTCAIALSSHGGLLLDEGLANERAARYYMLKRTDKERASSHFQLAVEAYAKWGASAKAEHLQEEMRKLY